MLKLYSEKQSGRSKCLQNGGNVFPLLSSCSKCLSYAESVNKHIHCNGDFYTNIYVLPYTVDVDNLLYKEYKLKSCKMYLKTTKTVTNKDLEAICS